MADKHHHGNEDQDDARADDHPENHRKIRLPIGRRALMLGRVLVKRRTHFQLPQAAARYGFPAEGSMADRGCSSPQNGKAGPVFRNVSAS